MNNEKDESTISKKIIYTNRYSQLIHVILPPKSELGFEIHLGDQFVQIESGNGIAVINDKIIHVIEGNSLNIPAGYKHNIINTSYQNLELRIIYSPPNETPGLIIKSKL